MCRCRRPSQWVTRFLPVELDVDSSVSPIPEGLEHVRPLGGVGTVPTGPRFVVDFGREELPPAGQISIVATRW